MDVFHLEQLRGQRAEQDKAYLEFFRNRQLSIGVYELPAGGVDGQQPHAEDEIYYVAAGRDTVRAGPDHPVHPIQEDLTLPWGSPPARKKPARLQPIRPPNPPTSPQP